MTNQISHFYFQHKASIRVQVLDGEPWFCLKDVLEALNIPRTSDLAQVAKGVVSNDTLKNRDRGALDPKGLRSIQTPTLGGKQRLSFVNEPNLYRVIFRSNKPEAKQFQDWVFNEVLPTIRKTGRYEHPVCNTPRKPMSEPLSGAEMKHLTWLVNDMVGEFRFKRIWSNAIWRCLRRAAGTPSPEPFGVNDIPALSQECRRILEVTGMVNNFICEAEKKMVRRLLHGHEDCGLVVGQLEQAFKGSCLSPESTRQLEQYEQIALTKLERRLPV